MSANGTFILASAGHAKPGITHCGVTREGFIAAAGDSRDIRDGRGILFEGTGSKARRRGRECTFTRAA